MQYDISNLGFKRIKSRISDVHSTNLIAFYYDILIVLS